MSSWLQVLSKLSPPAVSVKSSSPDPGGDSSKDELKDEDQDGCGQIEEQFPPVEEVTRTEEASNSNENHEVQVSQSYGHLFDENKLLPFLRQTKWFDNRELWKDHFDEFIEHYLTSAYHLDRNKHRDVRLDRVLHLIQGHDYTAENEDMSNWTNDKFMARLVQKVYLANHKEGGLFAVLRAEAMDKYSKYRKVFDIVRSKRDAWLKTNGPKEPVGSRPAVRRSRREGTTTRTLPEPIAQNNPYGGQFFVIWGKDFEKEPFIFKVDKVGQKGYAQVRNEIANKLHMTSKELHDAEIMVVEPLNSLLGPFNEQEQVKISEIKRESAKMSSEGWNNLKRRAQESVYPITIEIRTTFFHVKTERENTSEVKEKELDDAAIGSAEDVEDDSVTDADQEGKGKKRKFTEIEASGENFEDTNATNADEGVNGKKNKSLKIVESEPEENEPVEGEPEDDDDHIY